MSDRTVPAQRDDLPPGATLREHVYDGIEEYDQRLPNWWLWSFYAAMIFSGLYWVSWYQTRVESTDAERVVQNLQKLEEARLASVGEINNDVLWQMAANSNLVATGKDIFMGNCVACHGANLEGGIGFNLVDNEWVHGNQAMDVYRVIDEGIIEKGMQAWGNVLGPQRVAQVAAYVISHHEREVMETAPIVTPDA